MNSNTHVSEGVVGVPRFALYGVAALSLAALLSSLLVLTSRKPVPAISRPEPAAEPTPVSPPVPTVQVRELPPARELKAAAPVAAPVASQEVDVVDRPKFDMEFQNSDEMKAHVEALYFQETVDRAWSTTAETTLAGTLEKVLPQGSRAEKVECKSTLCRIDLIHQDSSVGPGTFFRQIANDRPWNGPIHMTAPETDASGAVRNNVYIARAGHPIPGIAE